MSSHAAQVRSLKNFSGKEIAKAAESTMRGLSRWESRWDEIAPYLEGWINERGKPIKQFSTSRRLTAADIEMLLDEDEELIIYLAEHCPIFQEVFDKEGMCAMEELRHSRLRERK